MTFRALYDGPLLATVVPCAVAGVTLLLAAAGRGMRATTVRVFAAVFSVAIALDAWLDGPWTPLPAGSAAAAAVAVFFVIVGDFRYFVLVEHTSARPRVLRAAALSLVVPVASQIARVTFPRHVGASDRVTYLVYELMFLLVAAAVWAQRRGARVAVMSSRFEVVQYGLWAGADVGLLATNADGFFGVRLAANLLYYVAFVPFAVALLGRNPR